MAQPAGEYVAACSGGAVGNSRAERLDRGGLEGRPVDPAAPHVNLLSSARPPDQGDVQGRSERRVDGCVDQGEIPAGDQHDDFGAPPDAAVEADREPTEGRDVLGGDDANLVARDGDHGARAHAEVVGTVRHDHDGSVVGAARRIPRRRGPGARGREAPRRPPRPEPRQRRRDEDVRGLECPYNRHPYRAIRPISDMKKSAAAGHTRGPRRAQYLRGLRSA